jgi:hypothetical protein
MRNIFQKTQSHDGTVVCGAIPGKFSVDASGGAVYHIDIPVPPGTARLEPKLALEYNSRFENGMVGVGWRLIGLSFITRVAATKATDGFIGAVSYGPDDRFSLDGLRLIAIQGEYGAAGTKYLTEVDVLSQVISQDSGKYDAGPASFVVRTRAGTTMEYGTDASSRILDPNGQGVRVWALNRVSDRRGNYMTIAYAQEAAGAYYPNAIEYTGFQGAGETPPSAPHRRVSFGWEQRTDQVPVYQAGSAISATQRLKSVSTFIEQTLVARFELNYTTGLVTRNSLLQ